MLEQPATLVHYKMLFLVLLAVVAVEVKTLYPAQVVLVVEAMQPRAVLRRLPEILEKQGAMGKQTLAAVVADLLLPDQIPRLMVLVQPVALVLHHSSPTFQQLGAVVAVVVLYLQEAQVVLVVVALEALTQQEQPEPQTQVAAVAVVAVQTMARLVDLELLL